MRDNGVCPYCGSSVNFYMGREDRSRCCPVCGAIIDIDDIIEKEDNE